MEDSLDFVLDFDLLTVESGGPLYVEVLLNVITE